MERSFQKYMFAATNSLLYKGVMDFCYRILWGTTAAHT